MTVQSTTATARDAIDDARERLAPAADRLTGAAGQVRDQLLDNLREQVAPKVAVAATQVREQVAPKVADKVAEVLTAAADRIGTHGAHGTHGTQGRRGGRSRWKPLAIVAGSVAGAVVVVRVVQARKAAESWEYDPSRFSSDRPDEQQISDPTEAKLKDTVDQAKAAVSDAVDSAGDKASDKGKVTDLSDRARSAAQN